MMGLARSLPKPLQASLFVVQHISATRHDSSHDSGPKREPSIEREVELIRRPATAHSTPLILARLQGAVPASVPSADAWPERAGS